MPKATSTSVRVRYNTPHVSGYTRRFTKSDFGDMAEASAVTFSAANGFTAEMTQAEYERLAELGEPVEIVQEEKSSPEQ